jgi:hypothetical protein
MRALLRVWAAFAVSLVFLSLVAVPRIARAEVPGPRATPVHVLGIDSDDAEDQADALTGAIRSRVRSAPGWSLQETQHALGMLTAALRCPQKPDAACLQRIGDQLHTDRFVWGVMSKAPGSQVTAEVHLWARGKPDSSTRETYTDNLQDQNDESLRKIASRILEKITGAGTNGTITVHAGDSEGVVWINGQKNRALEHGAATIELAPGRYDVELRAQGYATAKQEMVNVIAGQDASVALRLVPIAAPSEPASAEQKVNVRRVAGWSLIGLGVVAEIVAGVEGIEFISAKNDLDTARQNVSSSIPDVCADSVAFNSSATTACNKYNAAANDRLVGAVLGVAGIVPLAVGAALLLTDTSRESSGARAPETTSRVEKRRLEVLPYASARGGGGVVSLTF